MSYGVLWTAKARRCLSKLPEKVATAAVESIYATLAENPQRVGKPLRFELAGLHSARRGDYRVIYETDGAAQRVTVVDIQHRADIYRPR
jgi:mRNA interferase RelE/StbE